MCLYHITHSKYNARKDGLLNVLCRIFAPDAKVPTQFYMEYRDRPRNESKFMSIYCQITKLIRDIKKQNGKTVKVYDLNTQGLINGGLLKEINVYFDEIKTNWSQLCFCISVLSL